MTIEGWINAVSSSVCQKVLAVCKKSTIYNVHVTFFAVNRCESKAVCLHFHVSPTIMLLMKLSC